jgi:peptide/nickel transport system ATP-binding protein
MGCDGSYGRAELVSKMDGANHNNNTPVLEVSNLDISYATEMGLLDAVRNVSLRIDQGESYGLVGESGSGKTTLALGVVRYLPANGRVRGGRILLNGTNLLDLSEAQMRRVWGAKIGVVYQNPSTSVNPAIVIGEQIAEVARTHLGMSGAQAWRKALDILTQVGMSDPEAVASRYAHQLSGGMLQRVLIAAALVTNPQLLIMDEPTTALDVTTEAVILDLIQELMQRYDSAVLYITHNLGVVARVCDRLGVMYAGELVEEGPIQQVFKHPLHPYTLGLLGCVPRIDASKHDVELNTIPGYIPQLDELPAGCIFAPRCFMAQEQCGREWPPPVAVAPGHLTACWRWAEVQHEPSWFVSPRQETARTIRRAVGAQRAAPLPLLEARGVKKYFKASGGGFPLLSRRGPSVVRAVDDISLDVGEGFTLGIVGESGCGKTTLARCICGLEEPTAGEIRLKGQELPPTVTKRPRSMLKKLQMVFQNPEASLNPQHTVGEIIGRPLELLGSIPKKEIPGRVIELLQAVHLPESYIVRLPHELSGGEKQRVAIARAFAANPVFMVCDEPISSLDVSVQASLMNLLVELQKSKGTAYLFVSHDLAAIRHISDWIAVIYLGQIWEVGPAEDVFAPPYHPYTEALLSAIPIPDPDIRQERIRLQGSVPSAINVPPGCRFHTRCPRKIGSICETEEPPWRDNGPYHRIRCHTPLAGLLRLQKAASGGDGCNKRVMD